MLKIWYDFGEGVVFGELRAGVDGEVEGGVLVGEGGGVWEEVSWEWVYGKHPSLYFWHFLGVQNVHAGLE